ncbi:MAG TPA: adenylate kinase [Planctomycetes bacterium]|nr:adenylate kinase [Planctomycetota bacterium]
MGEILVFLGPPGAGKGTLASWYREKTGARHISTGDVLRQAVKDGTEVGKVAAGYMDAGKLVPLEVILDVLFEAVPNFSEGTILLDGFPRTVEQAEALDQRLSEKGLEVNRVVLFEIPDEDVVKRLSSRLLCPECGAVYNLESAPPKQEGVCDACGESLIRRRDDEPDSIRERLKVYWDSTAPLVSYYKERGKLIPIDASKGIQEVRAELEKVSG